MRSSAAADVAATPASPLQPQATQASRLRWLIIALVFFATIINFLDRLTISVLAVPICQSLHLNNLQFASISTWFLLAYTISQGISGRVFDRIGTKLGFTISVVIWSTAAMAHSVARGLASLSIFRALLGLGEAGNWPGATKVIAEWFPVRERALAMGIFNSGPSLGSVIAPPLIVWLNLRYGWQAAFLVTGSLGFLWLFAWLLIYRPAPVAVEEAPPSSSEMPPQPLAASRKILEYESPLAIDDDAAWTWRELLLHRQVWAIICCRVLVDPVWWLYILWLPKYLGAARGLSLQQAGWRTSIPFIAADIGALTGGFASGYLIQRRWSVDASRKTIVILATVPMMAGFFAPHASSLVMALAYISCVTFGFQAWINNVQTLPTDLFPERAVATVAGLGGVGAGIGSMIFTLSTGWVVDHFSYTPVLMTAGLLPAAGTAVLLALLGRVEPVHRRA